MKRVLLSLFVFISVFANAQTWKSHPKKPYSGTDSCLVFQDSTKKFYRVKCSEIGGGSSAAIDTTKQYYIAQGRGSTPFLLYFNGTAWVKNDTTYIAQSGNEKIGGNLYFNASGRYIGRKDLSSIRFNDNQIYANVEDVDNQAYVSPSVGSGNADVSLFARDKNDLSRSRSLVFQTGGKFVATGGYIKGDSVYRDSDSLRYVQLKDADERYAPIGSGAVSSVFGRTGAVVADSGDYDISQITGGLSDTLADGKIWIGDGTNTAFPRTPSGDVTMDNLGVFTYNGIVPLSKGGTNSNLSATGGTGHFLKQNTVGGNITVGQVSATELTGILPINNGGTGEGALTQWDFTDGTKKLKGNNITMQYYSEQAYWGFFYQNWSADSNFFYKYVAPQIDWSKANGCNAVRMIGFVAGIVNGTYTLAQYNAMQVQIIRYLQSKRMYYYPCFGSMGDGLTYSQFTDSTSTGYVGRCVSVSQIFTQHTNVIGIDMCNEILFTTGGFTSNQQINFIAILSRNIRALYPTLNLSASITSSTEGITSSFDKGNSNIVNISTYFDFIDRHMYTTNTYEAPDNLSFYSKPIIMGEYGATSSLSTRMLSMPPLLAANGVNGGFFFCQNSYDNLAINQYGLYDPNYIPLDPLAAIYFATLIPSQGYQKKLTKVFCASFYANGSTPLSSYVPDLNTPVTLGAITGSPVINSINQLNMPLSSNFRISNVANGDMVRSQIITLVALSEIRWQFHNSSNVVQFTCRIITDAGNTQVTMEILNAAGTVLATSGALTTSFASIFEMWYDGTTVRMRNGLTNIGISASAPGFSVNRMFLVNNAGGSAVIKQLTVFRP